MTLLNPINGNLAFKIFPISNHRAFDHIQRFNYYSLILIQEGEGSFHADFSSYLFKGRNLFAFAPYQPFRFQTSEPFFGYVIHFHPDFFCIHKHHAEVACHGILFNNIYKPPYLSLSEEEEKELLKIIQDMQIEMTLPGLAQYDLLISYLKIFLIRASRFKQGLYPENGIPENTRNESLLVQGLKEAIETHYKEKHTVTEYAEILKTPQKTLARISKAHFNRTITNLISERIIIEAKRELYLTAKPVKNIAFDLGFTDEHYFSRFFKNNTEISPQLYRDTVGFARGEA